MSQITESTIELKRLETIKSEIVDNLKEKNKESFNKLSLPKEKQEDWRYTNVEKLDLNKYNFEDAILNISNLPKNLEEKGVILTDINSAFNNHKELVEKYFFKSIKEDFDKFTALNASSFSNGVFLYIPSNTEIDIPIRLITTLNNSIAHNLIIVEENSSLNFIEELNNTEQETLHNELTEIFINQNSIVNYYNIRNLNENKSSFSHKIATLNKNSKINWFSACFGGTLNRLRIDTHFNGNNSDSKNIGLFLSRNKEHLDITTNVTHNALNTTNDIKFDGILKEFSTSVYRGLITITPNGQNTNSYLSNNILKIGEKTLANSIPALKIDANEVKASHGATIGQVSEEHLFYLMSRGLSRDEAEKLIVQGFLEPLIEHFNIDELKNKIREILQIA
tara:strand:+ start:696 stop:1877 length:1182 start_codon:yes stop_codon:yes gene_type:complete